MMALRVVVKQEIRRDCEWHDATFTEYVTSYEKASYIVKRFEINEPDRRVNSIKIELIYIQD